MKSLAILVSGGNTSDFTQLLTLLMAAVHEEMKVSVLFRGQSVYRLTPERINELNLVEFHAQDAAGVRQRLEQYDLADPHRLLEDIKASGDVTYNVCSSSLALAGLEEKDLVELVDGVVGLPHFLSSEMAQADQVLTF